MPAAFFYSSTAGTYTLTGSITNSATSVTVSSVTGLPSSLPYKVVIDPGQGTEEIVKVTAVAGTTLTVVRAWDGTSAAAHSAGATVRHMMTAEDLTLSRTHEAATSSVHGTTSAVVGLTDTQTLTNKNLTSGTNTFPSSLVTLTGTQVLTNKDLTSATNTFPSSLATLSGAQALTNKDLSTGNTFPSSLATLTGAQTLTNKTMSGANNTFSAIPESAVTNLVTDLAALQSTTADSGWQNVTVNGGFAGQGGTPPQVRKIGNRVFARWGWSNTGIAANTETTNVGTIPAGYRPARVTYINAVGSTGNQYSMFVINPSGAVSVRASSGLPDYFLFPGELNGWFLD